MPRTMSYMKVKAVLISIVFVAIFAMGGCGGGGSKPAGVQLPTFVPGSVSDDDFDAASATLQATFAQVVGKAGAAATMVAKMKTLKQFAYAQVSESGDAFGWMTDGTPYIVELSDGDGVDGTLPTPAKPALRQVVAKPQEIPGAPNAYLINAMEPIRADPTAIIAPELKAAGYNVRQMSGAVADYKSISDAGLVVLNAHGLPEPLVLTNPRFYLSTSEYNTRELRHTYRFDLYDRKMAVVLCEVYYDASWNFRLAEKFAVTPELMHDSGDSFAKNSLFLNMACWSNSGLISNKMISSGQGFSGLAVYAGWTLPSLTYYASQSVVFTIDRMLGLNKQTPVDPTNPPPADWKKMVGVLANTKRPDVAWKMDTAILPRSVANGATTNWIFSHSPSSDLATIIPAISSADSDGTAQTLTIRGDFSATPGSVTLDGSFLTVKTWTATAITAELPTATSGKLVVRDLGGTSNAGYLLSNGYAYSRLSLTIAPSTPVLTTGAKQTFTVSASTGQLPATPKYKWTLTGKGSIGSGITVTTTQPSIAYTAPNTDATDALSVEVLDKSGTSLAKKSISISVGSITNQVSLTFNGQAAYWHQYFPLGSPGIPDGTYNFASTGYQYRLVQASPPMIAVSPNPWSTPNGYSTQFTYVPLTTGGQIGPLPIGTTTGSLFFPPHGGPATGSGSPFDLTSAGPGSDYHGMHTSDDYDWSLTIQTPFQTITGVQATLGTPAHTYQFNIQLFKMSFAHSHEHEPSTDGSVFGITGQATMPYIDSGSIKVLN